MATPPLLYKFTIVDSFINFDSEETGEPLGITYSVFCNKTDRLFLTDEKYYLKCYDVK
jgi:hypothetical protein